MWLIFKALLGKWECATREIIRCLWLINSFPPKKSIPHPDSVHYLTQLLSSCLVTGSFFNRISLQRSILHDVCEVAGLVAYSFGEEDVDRHTVVWKKEAAPAEEELACLRRDATFNRMT